MEELVGFTGVELEVGPLGWPVFVIVMQVVSPFDQVIVLVTTWHWWQTGGGVGGKGCAVTVTVFVTVAAAGQLWTGGGIGVWLGAFVHVSVMVETQTVGM